MGTYKQLKITPLINTNSNSILLLKLSSYQKRYLQEIMLHILDVRDALDTDRFLHVHFDPVFDAQSAKSSGGADAGAKAGAQAVEEQGLSDTRNHCRQNS